MQSWLPGDITHFKRETKIMIKDAVLQLGKKKHRRTLDKVGGVSTVIGSGSKFVGEISGEENIVIHGQIEGDCNLQGTVVVEEGAKWIGTIKASNVVIAGYVKGDISAKEKLELASTAEIEGNLAGPVIAVAEGAIIKGNMQMTEGAKVTHFKDQRGSRD